MKLLIASDIHGSKQLWEQLLEQAQSKDLKAVIICGDLTKVGTRYFLADAELAEIYMQRLGKFLPVYYIFGNHDINLNPYKFKNVHQLVNFPITVEGLSMAGINLSPCFDMPHLKQAWRDMTDDREADAVAFYKLPPVDILVSHCPPYGVLGQTDSGVNIGSPGLRYYIDVHQPKLVLCGHVHEAAGTTTRGVTTIINTAEKVQTFELLI